MFERKLEDLKNSFEAYTFLLCTASWCHDECQRKNGPHYSKSVVLFCCLNARKAWGRKIGLSVDISSSYRKGKE